MGIRYNCTNHCCFRKLKKDVTLFLLLKATLHHILCNNSTSLLSEIEFCIQLQNLIHFDFHEIKWKYMVMGRREGIKVIRHGKPCFPPGCNSSLFQLFSGNSDDRQTFVILSWGRTKDYFSLPLHIKNTVSLTEQFL